MLGPVQRLVAAGHQPAGLLLGHRVGHRQADAQGQAAFGAHRVGDAEAGDQLVNPRGDVLAALQAGVGEDDGELLAAIAAHHVALALQAVLQHAGDLAQGIVAGQVAEAVVVGLEVVDIHH